MRKSWLLFTAGLRLKSCRYKLSDLFVSPVSICKASLPYQYNKVLHKKTIMQLNSSFDLYLPKACQADWEHKFIDFLACKVKASSLPFHMLSHSWASPSPEHFRLGSKEQQGPCPRRGILQRSPETFETKREADRGLRRSASWLRLVLCDVTRVENVRSEPITSAHVEIFAKGPWTEPYVHNCWKGIFYLCCAEQIFLRFFVWHRSKKLRNADYESNLPLF